MDRLNNCMCLTESSVACKVLRKKTHFYQTLKTINQNLFLTEEKKPILAVQHSNASSPHPSSLWGHELPPGTLKTNWCGWAGFALCMEMTFLRTCQRTLPVCPCSWPTGLRATRPWLEAGSRRLLTAASAAWPSAPWTSAGWWPCGLAANWTEPPLLWNLSSPCPTCPSPWIFHMPSTQRMPKLCGTRSKKCQGRSRKRRWMSSWTAFTPTSTGTSRSTCQLQSWWRFQ